MVTIDTVHSIGQPCGFTKLFDVNLTEVDTRTRWFVILGVGEENRLNTSPLLCWSVPSSSWLTQCLITTTLSISTGSLI